MPIRPELRPLYPPHWHELSVRARFERAGGRCQGCGRPHLATIRCLTPAGRKLVRLGDGDLARPARPCGPLAEPAGGDPAARTTRVVLAAAHLDHEPRDLRHPCVIQVQA